MLPEDYPAQDVFTKIGEKYHSRIMDVVETVPTEEWQHGEDPYQSVALYPAEKPRGDVVVMIHGGGWTNGYKEWMAFCAPALTARGITAASLGYRLAPSHVWPAGFEDVADGVAEIYRRAGEFEADQSRIFVSGHSAGGHLATLLALRSDWQASRDLPDDVIKGALPISGTYVFGSDSGLSMRPRFLGPEGAGNEQAASPRRHIRNGAPAFHIAWGENDFPHLRSQADAFAKALAIGTNAVSTQVLADVDHLGASYASAEVNGAWITEADKFLNRT
jgi:arylformamidase